jgi:hypothetical protein
MKELLLVCMFPDALELGIFLLIAKLGLVTLDCQFMELIMGLTHPIDEFTWLLGSKYMMYEFLHFIDVERLVQNFLGRFTVLGLDQSYCYNLCTPMLLASILTTFSTHLSVVTYELIIFWEMDLLCGCSKLLLF